MIAATQLRILEVRGPLEERSLEGKPIPPDTPPNRTYVPQGVRSVVLEWARSSSFTCHPGVRLWWWGGVLGAAAGEGVNTQLPGDRHSCQIISGRVIS